MILKNIAIILNPKLKRHEQKIQPIRATIADFAEVLLPKRMNIFHLARVTTADIYVSDPKRKEMIP